MNTRIIKTGNRIYIRMIKESACCASTKCKAGRTKFTNEAIAEPLQTTRWIQITGNLLAVCNHCKLSLKTLSQLKDAMTMYNAMEHLKSKHKYKHTSRLLDNSKHLYPMGE